MPCPILRQSGGFKPVLVNVDEQGVGRITGVVRPEGLAQTDWCKRTRIERLARQAVPAVGQRFGVGKDAAERVNGTGTSLYIGWAYESGAPATRRATRTVVPSA